MQTTDAISGPRAVGTQPSWSAARAAAGRDAIVPKDFHFGAEEEHPRFDSVVVRGSGIGALSCAIRLARSRSFEGRVLVAGSPLKESARLIGGCTLRARALDYFALAIGTTRALLIEEIFGHSASSAATYQQLFAIASGNNENLRLRRFGVWQSASKHDPQAALAFGLRNGHLVSTLREHAQARGVQFVGELPHSLQDCRDLALGTQPMVIDAANRPLQDGRPGGGPTGFIAASQLTFRQSSREVDKNQGRLVPGASALIGKRSRYGMDLGVFYPFADELTTQADYYGIFYRAVPSSEADNAESHKAAMRETVRRVGAVLDLHPTDEEHTRGEAFIPSYSWSNVVDEVPGLLHLQRTYDAGVPIISGDGMSRAGLAGWLAAEAILAGTDPSPLLNRSLRRWRRANRNLSLVMTTLAPLVHPILRVIPGTGVKLVADVPDMWAAVG